ncbi:hypothetical protein F3Y22_tig00113725pilonHSYRG00513 [Hibiscus syriacus]|uniref:Uncharacterized protein n=1 Tax=Hibiscus syriacus TaxID=106335 RepID=A0A6A2WMQ0_HIBSY|nr:hypothetical protein F3Y22_tig00113725pilonHSYRG00513 [Hibiscus syriacus]
MQVHLTVSAPASPQDDDVYNDVDDPVTCVPDKPPSVGSEMPPYFQSMMETLDLRFASMESHFTALGTQVSEITS